MEARYFYFTVHSARDLVDVRNLGEMKVYAKVTIAGQSKNTQVDLVNKTNPNWNARLRFLVPEEDIVGEAVPASVELFCERSLLEDKYVGELNLSLAPFYKGECNFSVRRNDSNLGKGFGTLRFSHELGDKVVVVSDSSKDYTEMAEMFKIGLDVVATVFNNI